MFDWMVNILHFWATRFMTFFKDCYTLQWQATVLLQIRLPLSRHVFKLFSDRTSVAFTLFRANLLAPLLRRAPLSVRGQDRAYNQIFCCACETPNVSWPGWELRVLFCFWFPGNSFPPEGCFMKPHPGCAQQTGAVKPIKESLHSSLSPDTAPRSEPPWPPQLPSHSQCSQATGPLWIPAHGTEVSDLELPPGTKLGHDWTPLVPFLPVRDHSSAYCAVSAKDGPSILSGFLVVYRG